MAERRRHKGIALLIIILTVPSALTGGCLAYLTATYSDWGDGSDALVLLSATVALVLAGSLLAWRAGTGYWWRRPSELPPVPWAPTPPGVRREVTCTGVEMRAQPGEGDPIGRLPAGVKVMVLREEGDFAKVSGPDGAMGWVPRGSLGQD